MLPGSDFIHSVIQFQYTGWPDFGAPTDTKSIIDLVSELKKKVTHLRKKECRVLVHCSAGVGRTGTFISLYQFMEILDEKVPEYKRLQRLSPGKSEDIEEMAIDIFNHVFSLRKQRCEMVCSESNRFIYFSGRIIYHLKINPIQ